MQPAAGVLASTARAMGLDDLGPEAESPGQAPITAKVQAAGAMSVSPASAESGGEDGAQVRVA